VRHLIPIATAASLAVLATPLAAQVSVLSTKPQPVVVQPLTVSTTELGSFRPEPGALVTLGYDWLTSGHTYITGDVREARDATGVRARGVQLTIREMDKIELPFVDADEIPALLRALGSLLSVTENPTRFQRFEVRYSTRDNLTFVAYNSPTGSIEYLIQAGSPARVTVHKLGTDQLLKVREMFETALLKLNQVSGG